jgi:hypothetical protein
VGALKKRTTKYWLRHIKNVKPKAHGLQVS